MPPPTLIPARFITPKRDHAPVSSHSPPHARTPAPGHHQSPSRLCLCLLGHFIETEFYNTWPFESGFPHLEHASVNSCFAVLWVFVYLPASGGGTVKLREDRHYGCCISTCLMRSYGSGTEGVACLLNKQCLSYSSKSGWVMFGCASISIPHMRNKMESSYWP